MPHGVCPERAQRVEGPRDRRRRHRCRCRRRGVPGSDASHHRSGRPARS
jgi:hypothetical protein